MVKNFLSSTNKIDRSIIAHEGSFVLFQPRKVRAISLQNSSFSSVFTLIFPISRKVPKTGVVFVATAGGSGEVERVICLGKKVLFLFVL